MDLTKNKFQKQEEKKVKYAPKKVFVLENGNYQEITYNELKTLEQADKEYANKYFLPLHGMLMEVTEEEYKAYYKDKRRQKYIEERSRENGDVSYDALDSSDMLGESVLVDIETNVEEQVTNKIILEQLHNAFLLLSEEEKEVITAIFKNNLTERELAKKKGVYHNAIHKQKNRILEKLKNFLNK